MSNKKNLTGFNLMEYGLYIQSIALSSESKDEAGKKVFTPNLDLLIEDLLLLDKTIKNLQDLCKS